jgi:hypothetical protein
MDIITGFLSKYRLRRCWINNHCGDTGVYQFRKKRDKRKEEISAGGYKRSDCDGKQNVKGYSGKVNEQ